MQVRLLQWNQCASEKVIHVPVSGTGIAATAASEPEGKHLLAMAAHHSSQAQGPSIAVFEDR